MQMGFERQVQPRRTASDLERHSSTLRTTADKHRGGVGSYAKAQVRFTHKSSQP